MNDQVYFFLTSCTSSAFYSGERYWYSILLVICWISATYF